MSPAAPVPEFRDQPKGFADNLSSKPYPSLPPRVAIRAALALRRLLLAVADRMVPAQVPLVERSFGVAVTEMLSAAASYGIADLLAEGPLTAAEIATRLDTDAEATHRMLRALSTMGVFRLHRDGRFANNRLSSALRSGTLSRAREWCEYFGSESNVRAWGDLSQTVQSGRNAFERVHGMSIWDWFDRRAGERETFAHAMMGVTVADAPVVARLYPFREIRRLCDVGGGRGTLLSEIVIRHPHLTGVLCDSPGVIESARELLARRNVTHRIELAAGNFFEAVPPGSDAYLLKNVLHDWDDARCVRILENCRRAMKPGGRMIVVERLTERNRTGILNAISDVQMMVISSEGRERSRSELKRLLGVSGFRPARVFDNPVTGIVEGIAS